MGVSGAGAADLQHNGVSLGVRRACALGRNKPEEYLRCAPHYRASYHCVT